MESLDDQYGYDESIFITKVPEYLHCTVCSLVLIEPLQILTCGHKICDVCFERFRVHSRGNSSELHCPVDRALLDLADVREDVYLRRVVGDLVVQCYKHDQGCEWQGELRELANHTKKCSFRPTKHDVETVGLTSDIVMDLTSRLEQCESSLTDKDKDIALLKHQLQEQQQLKEEMLALKQQISQLAWKNIEMEQKMQQVKLSHEQEMADLRCKNEILEKQVSQFSQKSTKLEEKLQQQHGNFHDRHCQEMDKKTSENHQLKLDILTTRVEMLEKGNGSSNTPSTSQASRSQPEPNFMEKPLTVSSKEIITVEYHNGDPKNVIISKDAHSVEFIGGATVTVPKAVVLPLSKVWYELECTRNRKDTFGWMRSGWADSGLPTSTDLVQVGDSVHSYAFNPFNALKYNNGTRCKWGKRFTGNTGVVGVALDLVKGEIMFSVDGQWTSPMGVAFTAIPTNIKLFPAFSGRMISFQYNFGDRDFAFGPPDSTFVKLLDATQ